MFDRIEELQTNEERLEDTVENLTELGELLPKDGVVVVNLEEEGRQSSATSYIGSCLKETLDLPQNLMLDMEKTSIVLFDDDGRKGLFLTSRNPEKQCRMGLPGFLPEESRFYYGAIWGYANEIEIYSSLGNRVFEKESHPMKMDDVKTLYGLCFLFSKYVLKAESDRETGKMVTRLSNVRVRNAGNPN